MQRSTARNPARWLFPLNGVWFMVAALAPEWTTMHTLKLTIVCLVALLANSCSEAPNWNATSIEGMMPDLQFSLTGSNGEEINAISLRGQPVLLFFGFTNCPDVCPTTLTQLKIAIKELGSNEKDLQVILVSVDPERDTPEIMQKYTALFGPWLLGLTGSEEALSALRKSYGVYAAMESSDAKGNYNIMHNAAVFAFDRKGQARLLISDLSDNKALVADLQQLINL